MRRRIWGFLLCVLLTAGGSKALFGQTTYYVRDISGALSLSTTAPNASNVTLSSQDINNLSPGEFVIQQFSTGSGVPGTAGVILSGSTVTFNLWMQATSTNVSSFPRAKLFLNSTAGTQLCNKTGTTALTTTLTQYTLSCTTTSNVYLGTSDKFLLWVGINTSTRATSSLIGQLQVEGTTTSDSTVVVPAITPPPSISNLTVNSGVPGTPVTINGNNFGSPQGSSTVTVHGVSATVTSWSANAIGITVPSATTGNIVVTVNGQASNGVSFTVPAPTITSVWPSSGRYGAPVTITGSNFGATQGAGSSTVKFGATTGSPGPWNDNSIAISVPAGAATGIVSVTVTVGLQSASTNFVVIPPPTITSLSQSSGPINTPITITGSGFGSPQGSSTITFNGTTAVPDSWGDGSIKALVPAGATTGQVVVTAGGQISNGLTFTVTGGPNITNINPASGAAGTPVTISGSNFGSSQGSSVVKFNGLAATVTPPWGSGSITATAPIGVSTGPVTVTVSGQTSNGFTFTAVTAGTLSGTISNGSTGIVGATVQAFQNGVSKGSTTTDSNGAYTLSNLAAGNYDIQASASGYGTGLKNSISIPPNQTTTQNFTLSTPGGVTGKVTQSDGVTAIPGATVQVYVGSAVFSSASTDSGGNYTIGGMNAASYRIQSSATGYVTKSQTTLVTGGSNTTVNFSLNAPGAAGVQYVYDELGRLVGVIDPSGDAAIYQYDAVGNILSISRQGSSLVSVISFTPRTGLTGATVTINGTGFSATPSQDTVQFNGTSATVSSATTTQLQVTVPNGATTGPITVTTPSGSAVSSANFTVGTQNGAPTITSFTPANGRSGTTIAITGTNFDPAMANDRVVLNATSAVTSSVVGTTTVNTSVPSNTASGKLSITTPTGKAISSQDFYIPFLNHVTGDIGWTGRTSLGGSQTVSLATGKIGLLLFDGSSGQGLSLNLSGSTFSSCTLYVFAPNGSQVGLNRSTQLSSGCSSATSSITSIPLQWNGTYTIGIEAGSTSSGSVTVGLTADTSSTIVIDGPPVTVSTSTAGQDARLSFSATAGQRIVVYATNVTNPGAGLFLVRPDGTTQNPSGMYINNSQAGQTFLLDTQTLAKTGTYQLWIWHNLSNVGSETLQIASVPADFTSSITVPPAGQTGPAVRVPMSGNLAVGQNATLTFTGTNGQILSFNALNSTIGTTNQCIIALYDPNNILKASGNCGTGSSYIDALRLTATGTYSILINPVGTATGSVSVSINNDADVTGTIVIDGPTVTTTTTVAGQDARLSFSATDGQRIVVYATSVTNPNATLYLVKADGITNQAWTAINNSPAGQTFYIDTQTLSPGGTYQLWVKHLTTNIGSVTLQIASVATNFTSPITVPAAGQTGPAVRVPTSGNLAVGQNATLTFSGTNGQILSFNVLNPAIGTVYYNCIFRVYNPSNIQIAGGNCGPGSPSYLDAVTLTATGTYTILIDPSGTATGSVSLSINNDADVTGSITIDGSAVTTTTTVAGQDARLSFSATAGQKIVVYATNVSNPNASLNILKPDGSYQFSNLGINNNPAGQTFFIDTQTLSAAGTYQLYVKHYQASIGSETLQIANVPADISSTVTIGGAAYSFTTVAGQNANITFSNSQTQNVTVHWTSGTYPSAYACILTVTGPNNFYHQTSCNTATGNFNLGSTPSGTYNILVNPYFQSAGGMSLTVTTP